MTPGELVYHRDMFFDIPVVVDLIAIQEKRQVMIDHNLMKQNQKRREYYYKIGDMVMVKAVNPSKLEPRAIGPYPITQIYTNGSVEIARTPHITERINLRRLVPYKQ